MSEKPAEYIIGCFSCNNISDSGNWLQWCPVWGHFLCVIYNNAYRDRVIAASVWCDLA